MLDLALVASAAALGLAGTPHCAAMCGAACTAAVGRLPAQACGTVAGPAAGQVRGAAATPWAFHLARIASYAMGGAVAAGSVGALAALSHLSPALRPLWSLMHVAVLALGIYLAWQGRQPAWMAALGRAQRPQAPAAGGWQPLAFPVQAVAAGSLWLAWPCGLLQSALLVAAMANTAWGGASAMAAFAAASSGGLVLAPWAIRRWAGNARAQRGATRAAGVLLAGASAWALGHGLWHQVVAFCFGA